MELEKIEVRKSDLSRLGLTMKAMHRIQEAWEKTPEGVPEKERFEYLAEMKNYLGIIHSMVQLFGKETIVSIPNLAEESITYTIDRFVSVFNEMLLKQGENPVGPDMIPPMFPEDHELTFEQRSAISEVTEKYNPVLID